MVGASLLQSDDDSDVPDLDLREPTGRRRNFFNKPSANDYEEIRHRRKTYKTIFLFSFIFVFLVSLYFLYAAMTRLRMLSEEVKGLQQNLATFENVHLELKKIKMQFELIRESAEIEKNEENNNTGTAYFFKHSGFTTTDLIYDRIGNISSRLDVLWEGFEKTSMSMEDVTSRMSRVEHKCLAVCHDTVSQQVPRGREQRRRQAKKITAGGDEIVFRRND